MQHFFDIMLFHNMFSFGATIVSPMQSDYREACVSGRVHLAWGGVQTDCK